MAPLPVLLKTPRPNQASQQPARLSRVDLTEIGGLRSGDAPVAPRVLQHQLFLLQRLKPPLANVGRPLA